MYIYTYICIYVYIYMFVYLKRDSVHGSLFLNCLMDQSWVNMHSVHDTEKPITLT